MKLLKPFCFLVVMIFASSSFAQEPEAEEQLIEPPITTEKIPPPPPPPPPPEPEVEKIFTVIESMTPYPGCEDEEGFDNQYDCAVKKMSYIMNSHIKYPAKARSNGTEGIVLVKFYMDKDGSIKNATIVQGIGDGCDEEVLRVVKLLPQAKQISSRGKAVKVYFNIPVKFSL